MHWQRTSQEKQQTKPTRSPSQPPPPPLLTITTITALSTISAITTSTTAKAFSCRRNNSGYPQTTNALIRRSPSRSHASAHPVLKQRSSSTTMSDDSASDFGGNQSDESMFEEPVVNLLLACPQTSKPIVR